MGRRTLTAAAAPPYGTFFDVTTLFGEPVGRISERLAFLNASGRLSAAQ